MVTFRVVKLAAVVALICTLFPVASATASNDDPGYAATRALVGARSRRDTNGARQSIEARGGKVLSYNETGNFFVVETPTDSKEWANSTRHDAGVRYAEPDYDISIDLSPNDPDWVNGNLYGMSKIHAPQAWDSETGSSSVVVGVIDTGVDYNHPDLNDNMWTNPGESGGGKETNGIDDDGNGWVDDVHGADCRNNDGNPMDDNGHGTHVSGTIGGEGNNGIGVVGVNWDVSIMALKFLSSAGSGSTSDAVECLQYATAMGVNLTSNSWGGGGYSQALFDAINDAKQHDELFVAAAGNSGVNTDSSPQYPAGYSLDNIISVAATDSNDALASFSNYGVNSVDLAAPGVNTWSTLPGGGYGSKSGTSMATPHVSGAAALLIADEPSLEGDYSTLKHRLLDLVDPIPGLATKVGSGGRLNVAAGVDFDPAPVVTSLTATQDGTVPSNYNLVAATSTDDEPVTQVAFYLDSSSSPFATDADGTDGWTGVWDSAASPDGNHTIKAVATDSALATGSRSTSVTTDNVDDPPTVAISSPAAGANVVGTISVSATAADDRGLTSVEFLRGSTSLGTDTDGSNGWSVSWNTTSLPDGNYTLTARATDNGSPSHTTTSSGRQVHVDNVKQMHVGDLDWARTSITGSYYKAVVTVTVHSDEETLVNGVVVTIRWGSGSPSTGTCTTSSGKCSVTSGKIRRSVNVTATVTGVTGGTLAYTSSANHDPDAAPQNSTGTVITVPHP